MLASEKSKGMGDMEEGMDLADEVDMGGKVSCFFVCATTLPLLTFQQLASCMDIFLASCTNHRGRMVFVMQ